MDVKVDLHDWTLIKIVYEWESGGSCKLFFRDRESKARDIEARNVSTLSVPRQEEWGPSVSVNSVSYERHSGCEELAVEMQSGDVIKITASDIQFA